MIQDMPLYPTGVCPVQQLHDLQVGGAHPEGRSQHVAQLDLLRSNVCVSLE